MEICDSCSNATTCDVCIDFNKDPPLCTNCKAGKYISLSACYECLAVCATCSTGTACLTCKDPLK